MSIRVVVLAAGKGTRMKSANPKVLHSILGKEIIRFVLDSASSLKPQKIYSVVGYGLEAVKKCVEDYKIDFVFQEKQLGTGHAVRLVAKQLSRYKGDVLILNGDLPAITPNTLKQFIKKHRKEKAVVSLITSNLPDPKGYGRVVRDIDGNVTNIVEHKDADSSQRKISEINSGAYCIDSAFLSKSINKIGSRNKQKEYYLPDLISLAVKQGLKVSTLIAKDSVEVLGVNDRRELAKVGSIIRDRVNSKLMLSGVTLVSPETTYISPDAKIGTDTVIHPNTYIYGSTKIGKSCSIGPNVFINNSNLGNNIEIKYSCYLTDCRVHNNVTIGPFSHLRPEAYIQRNAKIGNFVEIKKSKIGVGSKVPHLSYIGDAFLGNNVNIGAGTITCNYDGVNKHQTVVEDNVFIGSDSMLVAPIKIGKGATTAAGSTITKDVDDYSLAIERNQQKEIKNWGKRKKSKK